MGTALRERLIQACFFTLVVELMSIPSTYGQGSSRSQLLAEPLLWEPVFGDSTRKGNLAEGVVVVECDPIWDGGVFGVLPGIALGGMFGITGICGEHDSCAPYLLIGAVAGAGIGALLDSMSCHAEQFRRPENEIESADGAMADG